MFEKSIRELSNSIFLNKKSMRELGFKHNTDKVTYHAYDRYYPIFLEKFRDRKITMCEIGVLNCGSINMWSEYFQDVKIFGVDNDKNRKCEKAEIIYADQSKSEDLEKICDIIGKCDFIIDDGSHHPQHQYDTFIKLFSSSLKFGGVYIIEDIECHYWKNDALASGYRVGENRATLNFFEKSYDLINEEFSKVKNDLDIATVTYAQNCIIITKRTEEEMEICRRPYRFEDRQ